MARFPSGIVAKPTRRRGRRRLCPKKATTALNASRPATIATVPKRAAMEDVLRLLL
jgi:hypothetical protein